MDVNRINSAICIVQATAAIPTTSEELYAHRKVSLLPSFGVQIRDDNQFGEEGEGSNREIHGEA
jgi:hypothetical protein